LIGSAAGCRWRAHLSEPRRGRGCDEKTARVATASTVWLSLKLSHLVSERPAPRHVLPRSQGVDATPNSTQATCHVNAARPAMSTLHVRSACHARGRSAPGSAALWRRPHRERRGPGRRSGRCARFAGICPEGRLLRRGLHAAYLSCSCLGRILGDTTRKLGGGLSAIGAPARLDARPGAECAAHPASLSSPPRDSGSRHPSPGMR
jgi:hypothetical protein